MKFISAMIGWVALAVFSSLLLTGCNTPAATDKTTATTPPADTNQPSINMPAPATAPVAKSGPSFEATRDWLITTLQQYGGSVSHSGSETTRDRDDAEIAFQHVQINNAGVLTYTREDKYQHQIPGKEKFYKAGFTFHRTIPLGAITGVQVVIKTNMNYIANSYTTTPYIQIKTGNLAVIGGDSAIKPDPDDKDAKGVDYFEKNALGEDGYNYDGMGLHSKISDEITLEIDHTPDAIPGQPMPVDPEAMARRLATALQHMVDICKDAYKVPAPTPQPF